MAKADQYNTVNDKPCWLDILTQVEPEETPLYATLPKGVKPTNYEFTYFVDKIGAVSLATIADGKGLASDSDFINHAANRQPITQYVQEMAEGWNISRGQANDMDPAGVKDETAAAQMRAALRLRLRIERSIGSDQAGNRFVDANVGSHMIAMGSFLNPSNTAIPEFARIQSGSIAETDTLTENAFRAVLQSVYDACGGKGLSYKLHAGSDLQTKITNFMRMLTGEQTFLRTQTLNSSPCELQAAVNVYRGDFGLVYIVPNPQLGWVESQETASAESKARGYLLNEDYISLSFVHDIYNKDLPDTTGAGDRGVMFAKYSLINRMPKACGKFIKAAGSGSGSGSGSSEASGTSGTSGTNAAGGTSGTSGTSGANAGGGTGTNP